MLEKYGVKLNNEEISQFEKYYNMLIEYNQRCNLTAITEKKDVYLKHFYDSLCLTKIHKLSNETILDVGSGAGFPSIPLKICNKNIDITIVDSLNKRINFLKDLCSKLELDANLIHARAEDYVIENREKFDIVTARAVARLNVLAELCIPFVKVGGYFIVLKGAQANEEIEEANSAINKLGCKFVDKIEYSLPEDKGLRYLVKYQKIKNTPDKYPRQFSKIKSKPL